MPSWDIIVYLEDNSCTYLPSSWAVNKEKSIYLWPAIKSVSRVRRLIDECVSPSVYINFNEYAAVYKATTSNITKAKDMTEKYLETSNISSDGETKETASSPEHEALASPRFEDVMKTREMPLEIASLDEASCKYKIVTYLQIVINLCN